jgi:Major Facilitator Superfamily
MGSRTDWRKGRLSTLLCRSSWKGLLPSARRPSTPKAMPWLILPVTSWRRRHGWSRPKSIPPALQPRSAPGLPAPIAAKRPALSFVPNRLRLADAGSSYAPSAQCEMKAYSQGWGRVLDHCPIFILGSSVAFVDGSVVNVALPALGHDLGASPADLSWTINTYLLPLGALLLLGGAAGDHFGRRRLFLIGLAVFTSASILCAVSPVLSWLLVGRGLQGLGAALLLPNSLAILGASFSGEARGQAIGTWAAAGALTGALGPLVGGWLVDTIGWRTIFLLNVPVAAAAAYLAWAYVAESKDRGEFGSLDWAGAALATAGLGLVTWSLTAASGAGAPPAALWGAACGRLCLSWSIRLAGGSAR